MNQNTLEIFLRRPLPVDGASVFSLIKQCPPLDINSLYCYLLQCSHFANTSVVANDNDEIVGFTSGYLIPERPGTLFIWQTAVAEKARGRGLGRRMITHILSRSQCCQVTYLETTITESNRASWSLFKGLAKKLCAPLNSKVLFDRDTHFNGGHDSEVLVRIGPINRVLIAKNSGNQNEDI